MKWKGYMHGTFILTIGIFLSFVMYLPLPVTLLRVYSAMAQYLHGQLSCHLYMAYQLLENMIRLGAYNKLRN